MDMSTPEMPIDIQDAKVRWGTAHLDAKTTIWIHFGSPSAIPIEIELSNPLTLGRFEETDIASQFDLDAYGAAEKGVSRQHASLALIVKTVMLTDLGSLNGTWLNGVRLPPNWPSVVRNGDEIRLSHLVLYISFKEPDGVVGS